MRAAINIEGAIALVFVAIVLLRAWQRSENKLLAPEHSPDWLYAGALLLAIGALFYRTLWFAPLSDDYTLIRQAAHASGSLLDGFFKPGGDGSYRPVGYALLVASGKWANTNSFRWHLVSLALHAVNALLVFAAARYAFKRTDVAAIAGAIFAVHGTRPEAVTWIAGRWDVIAGFFVLAGLLAFLRYYDSGNWPMGALSVLLVATAIMCKESAYGFPALAAAFVVRRGYNRRLLTSLIAPTILLVYRFMLFHGPGGYIDPQTGRSQILGIHFLTTVKGLFLRLWAVLVFPIDWAQQPEWYLWTAILLMLGCLIGLCVVENSLDRTTALILAGCTMAAALPAVHLLGIGSDLLGSRVDYLPAIPFALFLALAVLSVPRRRLARAMGCFVVLFYAATLVHNLSIWDRVSNLAGRTCIDAAHQLEGAHAALIVGIPIAIDGVNFFANGLPDCVALYSIAPPQEWVINHDGRNAPPGKDRVLIWDTISNRLR